MKHRIRKTGEIISVINFNGTTEERSTDRVSYVDSKGYHHTDVQMNYYWDLEEVDDSKEIDWEERRFITARNIIIGLAQNSHQRIVDSSSEELVRWSIETADELIKQLKNK